MLKVYFELGYLRGREGGRRYSIHRVRRGLSVGYENYVKPLSARKLGVDVVKGLKQLFKELHRGYMELDEEGIRYWEEISKRYGYRRGRTAYISSGLRKAFSKENVEDVGVGVGVGVGGGVKFCKDIVSGANLSYVSGKGGGKVLLRKKLLEEELKTFRVGEEQRSERASKSRAYIEGAGYSLTNWLLTPIIEDEQGLKEGLKLGLIEERGERLE